jgi:hypothetical protein
VVEAKHESHRGDGVPENMQACLGWGCGNIFG